MKNYVPISNLEQYNPKGILLICTEKRRKQRGYCRLSRVRGRRFSRSNWSAAALSLNFEAAEEEEEMKEGVMAGSSC